MFDHYTQEELNELKSYIDAIDPRFRIVDLEKISIRQLLNGVTKETPDDLGLNSQILKNNFDDFSIDNIGVIRYTLENGESYYIHERGYTMNMVKLFDMSLPIDKVRQLAAENLFTEYKLSGYTITGGKSKKRKHTKRKKVRRTYKKRN